jgi:transposase
VADGPRQDLAETLGQWLDIADAIALSAALNGRSAAAPAAPKGAPQAVVAEVERVRAALDSLIRKSCSAVAGEARLQFPSPPASGPGASGDPGGGYTPYHRFYLAVQRELDNQIRPLRQQLREALSHGAPEQQRLAVLDAQLDKVLGERERRLLGNVPLLLERRFTELLATPADAASGLATFRDELQRVLLAELELRLLPATGLAATLNQEFSNNETSS